MQSLVAVSDNIDRNSKQIIMYSTYDYAYNGFLYLNNIMRPRHKRLSQLMIYSMTACLCFATNLSYFCGRFNIQVY